MMKKQSKAIAKDDMERKKIFPRNKRKRYLWGTLMILGLFIISIGYGSTYRLGGTTYIDETAPLAGSISKNASMAFQWSVQSASNGMTEICIDGSCRYNSTLTLGTWYYAEYKYPMLNGSHTWRARVTNADGTYMQGPLISFTVQAPAIPNQIAPVNGATFTSSTPTLSWSAVSSIGFVTPMNYNLWIYAGTSCGVNIYLYAGAGLTTATSTTLASLPNGTYSRWVNAQDSTSPYTNVGAFSTCRTFTVLSPPPTITAEPQCTAGTSNTVSSSTSAAQYEFCASRGIDMTPTSCDGQTAYTSAGRSSNNFATFNTLDNRRLYYYFVRVKDGVGNISDWSSSTSSMQNQLTPGLTQTSPIPTYTNDSTPDYSFYINESTSITYGLGGCTSTTPINFFGANTITLSPLTDGTYNNCSITVTDCLGQQETLAIPTFTIDTIAPSVGTATINAGTTYGSFYKGLINIRALASDANGIASCQYTLNGGSTWNAASYDGVACYVVNINPATNITINFRATDNSGKLGTGTAAIYSTDTTAPTTTITPNGNTCSASDISTSLSCSDGGVGCSITQYKIIPSATTCDTTSLSTYVGAFSVAGTAGSYTQSRVCYRSSDNLSNTETIKTSNLFNIDKAAPSNTLLSSPANTAIFTATLTPTLSWTSSTEVGCSSVVYDGQLCSDSACAFVIQSNTATSSTTRTLNTLTNGVTYYRRVRSKDALGNLGTRTATRSFTISIDSTAPTTTITPNGATCSSADISTSLSCSDGGVGCTTTQYKIVSSATICDTTSLSTYASAFSVAGTASAYTQSRVCYRSTDNLNNIEGIKTSNLFNIDKVGPSVPSLTSSASYASYTPSLSRNTASDVGCSSVASYTLEVHTNSSCSALQQTSSTASTSYTTTSLSNGTYYHRVRAVDALGNIGTRSSCTAFSVNVITDTTPPTTTITPDGASCSSADISTQLSCSDAGVGCSNTQYKIVSSATTCDTTSLSTYVGAFSVPGTASAYTQSRVCYRSTDNLNNIEGIKTSNLFNIDKAAPSNTSLSSPADTAIYIATLTPTLSWTASTEVGCSSVLYDRQVCSNSACLSIVQSFTATSATSQTLSTLINGNTYYRRVRSRDALGNIGTRTATRSFTINIDATAPTTSILPNGATCSASDVSTQLFCSDGGVGCVSTQYKIVSSATTCDTTLLSTYASSFSVPGTASAYTQNKVCYRSTDNLSNVEAINTSNNFNIDKVGPSAPSLTSSASYATYTPSLSRNSSSDVGCSSVASYTLEVHTNSSCSALQQTSSTASTSYTTTSLSNGTYYHRVRAVDALGNIGTRSSCTAFTVGVVTDTTAPTTTITPDGATCSASDISTSLSCSDAGVGCSNTQYKIVSSATTCDTTSLSTYVGAFSVPGTASAYTQNKVCYRSSDTVPNVETIKTSSNFNIDKAAPSNTSLSSPADTTILTTLTPTLNWTASTEVGCSSVLYDRQVCSNSACLSVVQSFTAISATSQTLSTLTNGNTYYRRVRSRDTLGNIGTRTATRSFTISIDSTAPTFTFANGNGPECTTGILTITSASDTGVGLNSNPYSFDGTTWGVITTITIPAQQPGSVTKTGWVRDALNNSGSKGATYTFTDIAPTANDFTFPLSIGNTGMTANRLTGSNAMEGNCGTTSLSFNGIIINGTKGTCIQVGTTGIKYIPNINQTGSDTCTIQIKDNENSIKNITITWTGIYTMPVVWPIFTNFLYGVTSPIIGNAITANRGKEVHNFVNRRKMDTASILSAGNIYINGSLQLTGGSTLCTSQNRGEMRLSGACFLGCTLTGRDQINKNCK